MGLEDESGKDVARYAATQHETTNKAPVLDSAIPQSVTDAIIRSEQLPTPLPRLGSSIIEDFIADKIQAGIVEPEKVADDFENEGFSERVEQYLHEVKAKSDSLDWSQIFSIRDFLDVKHTLASEMSSLGIQAEKISQIVRMRAQITEDVGVSHVDESTIYVSKLQAVRKALDYQKVFGNDTSIEELVKIFMTVTAGHELGHKIDHLTPGLAVSHIPPDPAWYKDGNTSENKSERFAEYWGRVALNGNEESNRLRQREWALQVAKTNQVWDTVRDYNGTHEPKAEPMSIFSTIHRKMGPGPAQAQASSLLKSRMGSYSDAAPENYASPYSREMISNAVRANNS